EPGKPYGPGPAEALNTALDMCSGFGFKVKNYDNYVGAVDLNDGERAVDMLAHMDVVGEGDGWDTDPFTATLKDDGCLYGRGTDDDKGPAVACIYGMRAVKELGIPVTKNARMILGTDEESGMSDLEYYFKQERSAPYTFSPDSGFPIYNTEKAMLTAHFTKKWSSETASPRICELSGGFRSNVIPDMAEAVICGIKADNLHALAEAFERRYENTRISVCDVDAGAKLSVTGIGGHSSTPWEAENSVTALLSLLSETALADCDSTRAVRELASVFPHRDYYGEAAGLKMEDEVSGPLTASLNILTMDGCSISGTVDCRAPMCATEDNCINVLRARLEAEGYAFEGRQKPAHHTPADSDFIRTLQRCYKATTGEECRCLAIGGGTYVHEIEGGVAFGTSREGFDTRLHSKNECVCVKDMLTAAKIFALCIAELCK
ncbi:MAG: Sapep family Mn(2+)-dependent dipeptidase, partial [Oscillospiraceae bacterium]|nr:Sapep family Mn(2+)-dependent dipeptidase [Oscillospiraceae bacterium]